MYISTCSFSFILQQILLIPKAFGTLKFGSSKEKITTRRMYIYLILDTNVRLFES